MVGGGRFSGGEGDEEEYDWDGDAERQRQRVEAWKRIVNRWWWWSFNGAVFIGVCWTWTIGGLAVGPTSPTPTALLWCCARVCWDADGEDDSYYR